MRHVKPIPSIETIAEVINEELQALRPRDPGDRRAGPLPGVRRRLLRLPRASAPPRATASAGCTGTPGVFGGVIETTEGLRYNLYTDRDGEPVAWNVAGPTCDSVDVVMRDELLPGDLQEGDFIFIKNAGAYTTAYASNFNGFPLPEVAVIGNGRDRPPTPRSGASAAVAQDFWASSGFRLLARGPEGWLVPGDDYLRHFLARAGARAAARGRARASATCTRASLDKPRLADRRGGPRGGRGRGRPRELDGVPALPRPAARRGLRRGLLRRPVPPRQRWRSRRPSSTRWRRRSCAGSSTARPTRGSRAPASSSSARSA